MKQGSSARRPFLFLFLFCVLILGVGCGDSSSPPPDSHTSPGRVAASLLPELDSKARREAERLGIPGAAWTVVAGTSIRHTQTTGVRNLQRSLPVTPRTLFGATTVTQAMTTSMMAALVDNQKIGWDDGIGQLQPRLAWPTAEWAQSVRLSHLLSMTSGLGGRAAKGTSSVHAVLSSLATLATEASVGERFISQPESFCGATFAVAAVALDEELGLDFGYRRLMQSHLFAPAGMRHSAIGFRLSAISDNHATAYELREGASTSSQVSTSSSTLAPGNSSLVEVESAETPGFEPLTGVASSIEDLGRFLILHLRGGIAESGQRVASRMNLAATRQPLGQLPAAACDTWPRASNCSYGMGWRIVELANGDRLLTQGGSTDGFSAVVAYLQQRQVGIAIVANAGASAAGDEFISAVRSYFFDQLLAASSPASKPATTDG